MSPVIDTRDDDGREQGIRAAVDAVRAGHLVVVPTDTVYGVGADAFDEAAVADLLDAKGRGREMPPPVLVPSPRTIDGLASSVPLYARDLIDEYWPGALTLVVRAQASLMWDLGDTNGTVAVRMPDEPLTLAVLSETGPLAVTSANRTGEPPARTVADAASQLGSRVAVYLDAGPSGDGEASTIVDCTGDAPVILRAGAISEEDVMAVLRGGRPSRGVDDDLDDDADGGEEGESPRPDGR
ncbi:MAG: L-threonylcarbamoyladenylate synthase [Mobilicoccus sp.]|nr:L-threonylcarbamoyladenylate synthase [Mobilicoccus sp.]